jgi:hypothetical protein
MTTPRLDLHALYRDVLAHAQADGLLEAEQQRHLQEQYARVLGELERYRKAMELTRTAEPALSRVQMPRMKPSVAAKFNVELDGKKPRS